MSFPRNIGMPRIVTILFVLGIVATMLSGCSKEKKSPALKPRVVERVADGWRLYDSTRIVVDSLWRDLHGQSGDSAANNRSILADTGSILIVTSIDADEAMDPMLTARFDMIELFREDSTGRPVSLFIDPVENGTTVSFRDLTGNGHEEIVVDLDAGGNDPITSKGMHVYGLREDGSHDMLFFCVAGAPELRDLDEDGSQEILLSDAFWGQASHAEVIGYTSAIYAFNGSTFVESGKNFSAWYLGIIGQKRQRYERLKQGGLYENLHTGFAGWLVWSFAYGGRDQAMNVWNTERAFLNKMLNPEQFDCLQSIIDDIESMVFEQEQALHSS